MSAPINVESGFERAFERSDTDLRKSCRLQVRIFFENRIERRNVRLAHDSADHFLGGLQIAWSVVTFDILQEVIQFPRMTQAHLGDRAGGPALQI
jgi:hypothetical protein